MATIYYPSGGAASLNAACLAAGSGGTVYLDGDATETVTVNAAVTGLKLYAASGLPAKPKVTAGMGVTNVIQYGYDWDIKGIEIDGAGTATDGFRGQAGASTDTRIWECVVHDVLGRAYEVKQDCSVLRCVAYNADRGFVESGTGIAWDTCLAWACTGANGHGFAMSSGGLAAHCIAMECGVGFFMGVGATVYNSVSLSNTSYGYQRVGAAVPATSCFGYNNGLANFKGTDESVPATCSDADPLIIGGSADPNDYIPAAGSPCKDFCTTTVGIGYDFFGGTRPVDAPDAGIYEVQATPPQVVSADDASFTQVDVTFSEEMDPDPAALLDAALWAVTPLLGGPAVTVSLVSIDAPAYVLVHLTVTPALGAATDYRATAPATAKDADGETIDPAHRSADFTTASGNVLSASTPDRRTVAVVFSFTPSGGSLLVPAAWLLEQTDGVSDVPAIETVTQDGATVTLGLAGPMSPGGAYRVTAPADIPGLVGRTATFVCNAWRAALGDEGVLEALTGAFGTQLAKVGGQPVTRLSLPLAPGDTAATVESTLHMPAAGGIVRILGEKIPFGAATSCLLTGLVRSATVIDTYPVGTEVRDDSFEWGQARRAWAETTLSKCPADFVDVAARDKGSPAPLAAMPTADRRTYAQVRHYLDAGTWWAAFRVLREGFRWASRTGTDAQTYAAVSGGVRRVDIPQTSLPPAEPLHDRWLVIGDRVLRVRAARSDIAAGQTTLYVEAAGGPTWEPSEDFTDDTGVSWELLAYRLVECQIGYYEADRLFGLLVVYLYITAGFLPATYLITSGLATPQSRLMRGKLSDSGAPVGHSNHQSFYLAQPYRTAVLDMLSDVVPAWCEIRVVMQRAAT